MMFQPFTATTITTAAALLLLGTVATIRLTRLFVYDSITEPLRFWAAHWKFSDSLITCPYCIGFWLSAATTVVIVFLHPTVSFLILAPFAVSEVVGRSLTED